VPKQRGPGSTHVVETCTSPLTRSRSPIWIGLNLSGGMDIATRSSFPGCLEIGTARNSSELSPLVA
jgi:hypothetical protein